jgi:ribosomal protein S18 acetylase RimI-like enzyme
MTDCFAESPEEHHRNVQLSAFTDADEAAVNRVALAAFEQYRDQYQDWPQFSQRIGSMASLAAGAEVVVARDGERVVGAVAYVGPGQPKAAFFAQEWPVLRMLVVEPSFRGRGVGRMLTEACVRRAVRDGAPLIALHTSHIMKVALAMYQRIGFRFESEAPAIHGVPYGIYIKKLNPRAEPGQ